MKETIKVENIKASHRKIYTDIVIKASSKQVWEVLIDTKSYKNWAALLVDIDGEIKNGNTITAKFQLNPSKQKFNSISHTIKVEDGKEFYWAEKGPLGICDNHHFKVEKLSENSCLFIQSDELKKGATFLLGGYLSKLYVKGYQAFNKSLKQEVEHRFKK